MHRFNDLADFTPAEISSLLALANRLDRQPDPNNGGGPDVTVFDSNPVGR